MDRKRGDSGDVKKQWQEVALDQYRLVENIINAAERSQQTTPGEEINTPHEQCQKLFTWDGSCYRIFYTINQQNISYIIQN